MIDLRNTKLDCRKPDGSIDLDKSKAFQKMVTGLSYERYSGRGIGASVIEVYDKEGSFLFSDEKMILSLGSNDGYGYFCNHKYKEVILEKNESGYVAKFKQDDEVIKKAEFKKAEFKTVGEVVDAVLGGERVYDVNNKDTYLVVKNGGIEWSDGCQWVMTSEYLEKNISPYLVKQDWIETVNPENPVWCWVWDYGENKYNTLAKVNGITNGLTHPYRSMNGLYRQAEPATEEEVLKFVTE